MQTFIKDLERELINSGKVTFVASKDERAEVRDERKDQQVVFTESSTTKENVNINNPAKRKKKFIWKIIYATQCHAENYE